VIDRRLYLGNTGVCTEGLSSQPVEGSKPKKTIENERQPETIRGVRTIESSKQ
jgi:hypothetical protein